MSYPIIITKQHTHVSGAECFTELFTKVKEGLAGVEKQPETAEKYSSLDKGWSQIIVQQSGQKVGHKS